MNGSPLRICVVTLEMGCGGVQRMVQSMTARLADAGHAVSLVLFHGDTTDFFAVDPRVRRSEPVAGGWEEFGPLDLAGRRRRLARIRRSILAHEPDVVVCHEDVPNVETLLALAFDRIPVIACEHADPRMHAIPRRWSLLRRLLYPRAEAVVTLNESVTRWSRGLRPRWPAVTIPNALEPAPTPEPPPADWLGARTLLAVGRLAPEKGFDLLVDAFARIADRRPEWQLTIFGEGPERTSLEGRIRDLGLDRRIRLVGAVHEPRRFLPFADLFVFPSRYESFGLALAEAMAAGLPVVSFDCPSGPATIVEDGIDGTLVPPEDVTALAEALAGLMADPDRRRRLGAAARRSSERFAPETVMRQWEDLLRKVTAPHRVGRA